MKYINVYMDRKGLWSASLCKDTHEIENIGGSYPKSINAARDAEMKWGRSYEIKTSYTPMFYSEELKNDVIQLLQEGVDSKGVADKFGLKLPWVRAVKAHVTMGTYKKELL